MSLFDHPRFHLLRHGQTAHNAADLIAGATDAPLDRTGMAQARAMARALADLPLRRLHASPLRRAWATAEALAADRPGLAITPAPDLAERHWGIWEGAPRGVLDRDATPLGGEGPAAFHARILRGCAAIPAPDGPEDPPLIVAHSGTVRVLCAALGVDFRRPPNCALITFYCDRRGCWQADPPRIAADFPTQPMRFP
ncbi:MAG: histidine phosphatase family protein [Paracoccus sp.]|nr:histidine phosphatase family protein [Paracoccus sp. (in: a-proteobacteria)]